MSNFHKEYQVLPFVKKVYWSVFVILILAELIVIRLNLQKILSQTAVAAILTVVVSSSVVLSIFYRLFIFIRPRVFSRYRLYDDKVDIVFKKKVKTIRFLHIRRLKISTLSPRFFGGFYVIMESGQQFMFPSLLQGCGDLFKAMIGARSTLLDPAEVYRFIAEVDYVRESWQRLAAKLKNIKLMSLLLLPAPLFLLSSTQFKNIEISKNNWIAFACVMLVGLGIWDLLEHKLIMKKRVQGKSFKLRNIEWMANGLYVILTVAIAYGFLKMLA